MNMAEMTPQDRYDLEKYRATERRRERERQIAAQAATGPVKTWQQREIEAEDLFQAQFLRGQWRY
jgi:hypothetical protein